MTTRREAVAKAIAVRDLLWDGHLPVNAARIANRGLVIRTEANGEKKKLEIKVQAMPDANDQASSRVYFDATQDHFVCQYNDNEIFYRANFGLAHALGHVFLGHVKDPLVIKESHTFNPDSQDSEHRAAIDFALELLLPEKYLRKLYGAARNVQELSEAFGVSNAAMIKRINYLGIL
ncbi:MAG: ImmA/IrrE family metallo-endopeptidase [Hafnia sp.]